MDVQGRVLLVGDSVTDCRRSDDPDGLGYGHVRLLATTAQLTSCTAVNRGVCGDRLVDLEERRERDVLVVPLDLALNQRAVETGVEALAAGGRYPTPLGHQEIAVAWLHTTAAP